MHFDHEQTKYPYIIRGEQDCKDCGFRFPVHENVMTEIRCVECQVKFRLAFAKRCQEDPTFKEYVAVTRTRVSKGYW